MSVDSDAVPVTRLLVQTGPDAPDPAVKSESTTLAEPIHPPEAAQASEPTEPADPAECPDDSTGIADSMGIAGSTGIAAGFADQADFGAVTGEIDTRTGEFFTRMNRRDRPGAASTRTGGHSAHAPRSAGAARRRRSSEAARSAADAPVPILDRLTRMAVSAHRVTDPMSVPGEITIDLDDAWQAAQSPGCLRLFVAGNGCEGTIAIVLTRFIVDHHTDLGALLDHAPVEARALPDWDEDDVVTTARGFRTEGASLQTGTYLDLGERRFCALRYEVFARGNVAYLVHTTGIVPLREGRELCREVVAAVSSVGLDD
ncbi:MULTISPECIES: hypothetical protein [Gordonia]|uniref:hypothetical protein n=1 Tax=Gordonia sp. 852002-51296_SCH5728562-b TaxID=1834101 RepID=UPI0007EC2296|nr:hypothetical protein [Gordonia sp. 852002-51296_SCH5728562-b]OBA38130.1 hypothetical protein A5766_05755 [Gordonia sp. 852002-51296_SCH5728562-b]